MIIRKPTKIELKLEDDMHEYDEFKSSQARKLNIFKENDLNNFSPVRNKNAFKINLGNDVFRNSNTNISKLITQD